MLPVLSQVDAINTGKVSLGPQKTYLGESGKGFDSNVGSIVCVAQERELEDLEERESIHHKDHF